MTRIVAQPSSKKVQEEAKAFLKSTEWYVRLADKGTPMPEDVKQARAAAREAIRKGT